MEQNESLIDQHENTLMRIHKIETEELRDIEAAIRNAARGMESIINKHMDQAFQEIMEAYGWRPEEVLIEMVDMTRHSKAPWRSDFKYGGCTVIGRHTRESAADWR